MAGLVRRERFPLGMSAVWPSWLSSRGELRRALARASFSAATTTARNACEAGKRVRTSGDARVVQGDCFKCASPGVTLASGLQTLNFRKKSWVRTPLAAALFCRSGRARQLRRLRYKPLHVLFCCLRAWPMQSERNPVRKRGRKPWPTSRREDEPLPFPSHHTHHLRETMQALKLARKYPNFSQEQMIQLVEQFKCVVSPLSSSPPLPDRGEHTAWGER